MKLITADQLASELEIPVIDVRLSEDYVAGHIPGAMSNCVFEVAFADRIPTQPPDRSRRCVIYGTDGISSEASVAAAKLERLGYTDVCILEGGWAAWSPVGSLGRSSANPPNLEGTMALDLTTSQVRWTGRNLLSRHCGTVGIKAGFLEFRGGNLVGGRAVFDMHAITCDDLDGAARQGLLHHLASDDFFDTVRFPESVLEIHSAEYRSDLEPGGQNLIVTGSFTLKGISAPIILGASVGLTPDGRLAAQGSFLLDRTVWGVIYGSGKFFRRLGMHLVNDLVDIEVAVATAPHPSGAASGGLA